MENLNLDFDRESRLGFPEVVYGASKSLETLEVILRQHAEVEKNAFVTRLQPEKASALMESFSGSTYDPVSGAFLLHQHDLSSRKKSVGIISAGTSDEFVVNEAYYTLNYLGVAAARINDIGVAGIHRLMTRLKELRTFRVLIVAAGFEGALPSVIGGLLAQPIIAVPTSIGYGVASDGRTALHAMLASCANGITVTNIDNGYGAAIAAFRILRLLK
ncbi:MAG: nickel pincer cofactor biosynthesis protein LarB [Opitutaceae bacterium]